MTFSPPGTLLRPSTTTDLYTCQRHATGRATIVFDTGLPALAIWLSETDGYLY